MLELAISSADFLVSDLIYYEDEKIAKIKYKPNESGDFFVLNVNALGARLLTRIGQYHKKDLYTSYALKLLNFVVNHQEPEGGWYYSVPKSYSHLGKDNYHNGFIIEALVEFSAINQSNNFDKHIEKAVNFYKHTLTATDFSPNWDHEKEFPKDIHACAAAVLLYTKLNEFDKARNSLNWTIDNLYYNGRFYYQKNKYYTNRTVLMRWGQAWMSYAISTYLLANTPPNRDVIT